MLSKMTVKELKAIAQDMGMPFTNRVLKADLIAAIEENIDRAHAEALEMNDVYTCQICKETVKVTEQASHMDGHPTEEEIYKIEIEGCEPVILTGINAKIMNAHEKAVKRFNPTMKRDEFGYVILTDKQRKRIRKGTNKRAKKLGLYV